MNISFPLEVLGVGRRALWMLTNALQLNYTPSPICNVEDRNYFIYLYFFIISCLFILFFKNLFNFVLHALM